MNNNMSTDRIAGVDEVGRGPLVGPVVAAAVILDPKRPINGLADSKALTEKRRIALDETIREYALAYCIAEASASEIDAMNILQASLLAMRRAVEGLSVQPDHVLVDGKHLPRWPYAATAVIQGDKQVAAISAASIIAKVNRDAQLVLLHAQHPHYGFDQHKGYPTRQHLAALEKYGPIAEHRRTFKPVQRLLEYC